jgi:hypothetical protein
VDFFVDRVDRHEVFGCFMASLPYSFIVQLVPYHIIDARDCGKVDVEASVKTFVGPVRWKFEIIFV